MQCIVNVDGTVAFQWSKISVAITNAIDHVPTVVAAV